LIFLRNHTPLNQRVQVRALVRPPDTARTSIVAKAKRSKAAYRKTITKKTDDGLPVQSFRSLLGDLATVTHNTIPLADQSDATFTLYPQLTTVQARALQLLGVSIQLVASKTAPLTLSFVGRFQVLVSRR
jgi:hypothetical protein